MNKSKISKHLLRIKKERLKRGWTQQELAHFSGLSAADVSRIENGILKPYPSQALRLARLLRIQPEELQQEVERVEE